MKMDIIKEIAGGLGIYSEKNRSSWNQELFAGKINELLTNDFQKLIAILYRMDVSEEKLKKLLSENPTVDAGVIIADLMIERQIKKIKYREQFTQQDETINENEKW